MYAYKKEDLEAFAALYTPSNPEKLRSIQYVDNPDADFAYIKMTCGLLDDELQTKELRISMIEMLNSQLPQGARYTQSRDESSDVYITKLCCHLLKYCETIGLVSLKNARIAAAKPAKYKSSDKTTQKYPSLKTTPVDLVRNLSTYYFLILCTLHDCLE